MRAAALAVCLLVSSAAAQGVPSEGEIAPGGVVNDHRPCEFMGHRLMGKVRIVSSFPDFRVKLEDEKEKAELWVRRVVGTPEMCGEWQMVDGMADFTIAFVEAGEDFKIAWVDDKDTPGIPEGPVMP